MPLIATPASTRSFLMVTRSCRRCCIFCAIRAANFACTKDLALLGLIAPSFPPRPAELLGPPDDFGPCSAISSSRFMEDTPHFRILRAQLAVRRKLSSCRREPPEEERSSCAADVACRSTGADIDMFCVTDVFGWRFEGASCARCT